MKKRLVYQDKKSHKFWEIAVSGKSHTVQYGKVGTTGQTKKKSFGSAAEAQKDAQKLIQSKLKKGYVAQKKPAKKPAKKTVSKVPTPPCRLIYQKGTSHKFWEVSIEGRAVTVSFGRVGTRGRTRTSNYVSEDDARRGVAMTIQHFLNKGYFPEGSPEAKKQALEAQKAPAPKKKAKPAIPQTLCFAGDHMFILFTTGGKARLAHYQKGKQKDVYPAAPGMWLSAAFLDDSGPNVLLASRQGMTQWIRPGQKAKKIGIPTAGTGPGKRGYLGIMTTFLNRVYLCGYKNQVYRFEDQQWLEDDQGIRQMDTGFDSGLLPFGKKLLFLTSDSGGYTLFAQEKGRWQILSEGKKHKFNCLGVHKTDIYLAGDDGIMRIGKGKKSKWLQPQMADDQEYDFSPWSSCSFQGQVLFSDHHSVKALKKNQLIDLGAPPDPKHQGASHNHCLYPHGDTLYYAHRTGIQLYRKGRWTAMPEPGL